MMFLKKGGQYDPYDKTARTKNTSSKWESGLVCLADVPTKGQVVYVNRPQNNAYAEECKVEIVKQGKHSEYYIARSPVDNWGHFFLARDVGNDIFFDYEDAMSAIRAMCIPLCDNCDNASANEEQPAETS